MKKKEKFPAINFEITVNGNPVEVMAKPYLAANEKRRFRVSYNGSPIHIFGLDEKAHEVAVIDSASEQIPVYLERAIGYELLHRIAA